MGHPYRNWTQWSLWVPSTAEYSVKSVVCPFPAGTARPRVFCLPRSAPWTAPCPSRRVGRPGDAPCSRTARNLAVLTFCTYRERETTGTSVWVLENVVYKNATLTEGYCGAPKALAAHSSGSYGWRHPEAKGMMCVRVGALGRARRGEEVVTLRCFLILSKINAKCVRFHLHPLCISIRLVNYHNE